jgi:hypothetical protein
MLATLDQVQSAAAEFDLDSGEVHDLVDAMRRRGARRMNQTKNAPEHRHGASLYPIHSKEQRLAMPTLLRPPEDVCAMEYAAS